MRHSNKILLKNLLCLASLLPVCQVKAQNTIIENILDKLNTYKSISYKSTYKQKDAIGDTLIRQNDEVFLNVPEEREVGYFFKIRSKNNEQQFFLTDLYFGENLISYGLPDSVYNTRKIQVNNFRGTLIGDLQWMLDMAKNRPGSLIKAKDTLFRSTIYDHFILIARDTVVNKEHLFTHHHLLIDKISGLLTAKILYSRRQVGDGIINAFREYYYYNYVFDEPKVDYATFVIPKGYHPPLKKFEKPAFLAKGTTAPDWTLFDLNGKKTSLSDMKGKVVLLDFYFIGCGGCMLSLKPLNNLHKKYKDKVVIASLTAQDSEKNVKAFKKAYNILYAGYTGAADVVKQYNVTAFPTFYFISQDGKVENVIEGYEDDFELKTAAIIDELLKKK